MAQNAEVKERSSFFGAKDVAVIIIVSVIVFIGWFHLNGRIQLLNEHISYKENQIQKDVLEVEQSFQTLVVEVKRQAGQDTDIVNRLREVEESLRRLWRDVRSE